MNLEPAKLFSFSEACARRRELRAASKGVILTNGCFDLLHAGHVFSIENARKLGDSLWIAMNSDASVRALKGLGRPIFDERSRAYMLSALGAVDGIFIFDGAELASEILKFEPDVYVKSEDYAIERLDVRERTALESVGAAIAFVPFLDGFSTTSTIGKISS
jgi:rfaE bifunctional protein nucleotidyltransferase chain/domain